MQDIKSIGVIGSRGMVGGTVYQYFKEKRKYDVYGYSKSDKIRIKEVQNSDIIFICVPTPYNWDIDKFDGSIVESTLLGITEGKIVVIKSTIPIGTTEYLQEKFPKLKILFNPEFLSESTAYSDFINPDRQFVGYTKQSYDVAIQVLNLLPESAYSLIIPSGEAELLKYVNNLHGALSVVEANHYYDICINQNLNYERVIKAAEASKWIGAPMSRQYHTIFHKDFRGYGGKCFPKDVAAHLEWCKTKGLNSTLFNAVRQYNKEILKCQGLTEEIAERK